MKYKKISVKLEAIDHVKYEDIYIPGKKPLEKYKG